ncbi:MAG: TonB-dependent receptor [Acidobacteriota bacterium]
MTAKRRVAGMLGVLLATTLSFAMPLWSQTTGSVEGRVADESEGVLPGVSVEATSAALQGSRQAITDAQGGYRLNLLPPGDYTIAFTLDGFAKQTSRVTVSLGKGSALNITLRAAAAESITVVAEAPVIDSRSASIAQNLSTRQINNLPTGRNYSSVVQVVPGTSSDANSENKDQSSISVYGSSGAENSFFIDGVNTTGVEYGFQGKNLNFEFVQEIDVKTGGYEAEYGKSTGGIINVITKSGGNAFKGDVFGYLDNDSLQAPAKSVSSTGGTVTGFTRKDYGLDLGGYFVKDKLWFFGAYDKVKNDTTSVLASGPLAGNKTKSPTDRDLGAAKLTWNVAQNHSLIGSFFQDPRTDGGAIVDADHSLNGEPATYLGEAKSGGRDYALRYDGLVGSSWSLSAQVARHEEKNEIGSATSGGGAIQFRDLAADSFQTGGFGLTQSKQFKRDFFGASATRFLTQHEIKFGVDHEVEKADVIKFMSGGQRVDILQNDVEPGRLIYDHFYWTTPTATVDNAPTSQLNGSPKHKNTAAFVQDRWSIGSGFLLSYGVRWDRQEIFDRFGAKVIDLKKDFAPRLGFTWDASGDGKSRLYGSYGKYFEQIPMDLVIRSFMQERQAHIINFNPTSLVPSDQAAEESGNTSRILGGFSEPADPNLRNQYISEYLLGYDREVMPDVALGVKLIHRSYDEVIEDFTCSFDGDYCIGNPGKGIMKELITLDYSGTRPAIKPKRVYNGLQLDATKRFSNNWQGMASYLYSKLDGNYDGEYAPFTNVGADPNISAAYDYFDFFTNGSDLSKITNTGPLSNDRRHQLKASGVYMTPIKLSIGVSAYWRSGLPLTRYGYSDAYGRYEFFLTKRGAEGRSPDTYETDVHLGYPLKVGPVEINFLADIFNLLDAQRAVIVDQRWGFQESDNASPTPVNPNYGKASLRTGPRTYRLGLRVSF